MTSYPDYRGAVRVLSWLMCIVLSQFLPSGVAAQVIDDFESGAFNYGGTVADGGSQGPLIPIHCIATTRSVAMTINGSLSVADLSLNWPDDEVTTVWGDNGGRLEFDYDPAATDLTFGNLYNAVRVHMPVAVPAGNLEVVLWDASGDNVLVSKAITGPGDYIFGFVEFAGIDPLAVEFIELNLSVPDFGDYHISDFRATDTGSAAAVIEVTQDTVEGPPYPTEPVQMTVFYRDPAVDLIPVENLQAGLYEVTNGAAPPATQMMAMDSGVGAGMPGRQVVVTVADLGVEPFTHRSFDLHIHAASIDPTSVELTTLPQPPEPVLPTQFRVEFTTYQIGSDGNPLRRVKHLLGFETAPGASLGGIIPCVMPGNPASDPNSLHIHFDVEMAAKVFSEEQSDVKANGDKDFIAAFEILLTAEVRDYHTSSGVTPRPLSLSLGPNVPNPFNPSTEIRFSLARTLPVRLAVHDVAGHEVKVLVDGELMAAGPNAVAWNGRDQSGRPMPSGNYLVTLAAGTEQSTRKIMMLK